MKRVEVVHIDDIEAKTFFLDEFTQYEASCVSIKKITKKELKELADKLELDYNDAQIVFAKKLLHAYLTGK
ncbi:MAG: hypothetical protein U9O64_03160 [Campylobacterota bacterium]|nr:hypothetical protein [Campylobacterota bacterium]